jgi:dTDP-4-dehydrorhamnose 3,5-epimerase-like enzyme
MTYKILNLPQIIDERGNLTFLQKGNVIPFDIQRVYWTYNAPGGETRGGHAYREQQELIVAVSGSFDVVLTDKHGNTEIIPLNRGYKGIYIPAGIWRHLENFSTNAVSLHLSSTIFDNGDYIRDFQEYKEFTI